MINQAARSPFRREDYRSSRSLSNCGASQVVGFCIVFARNMRNGELKRAGQFSAGPVQRIKPWTATGVFPRHLLDHYF